MGTRVGTTGSRGQSRRGKLEGRIHHVLFVCLFRSHAPAGIYPDSLVIPGPRRRGFVQVGLCRHGIGTFLSWIHQVQLFTVELVLEWFRNTIVGWYLRNSCVQYWILCEWID